jgi:hypothetical protein
MKPITVNGTVRAGKIELDPAINLPEGSQVSIVIPTILDEQSARRKANGWLIDNVGNMLMAQNGRFSQNEKMTLWEFDVVVTSLSRPAIGPIGMVTVNAYNGEVMNNTTSIESMIYVGQELTRSV